MSLTSLLSRMPKAELHLHIEGTLSPTLMWQLASKHGVTLPYESVEDIEAAYRFEDLQSFLDLYYQGADVLRDEEDFYQLMMAYLTKCHDQHIVHTEMMFDPQTHTERGIGFDVFMPGFLRAMKEAKAQWGITGYLILSFLRDMSQEAAFQTLREAEPWYENITAFGLDSAEVGHPPEKFRAVFDKVRSLGFKVVAHAGEEGPPEYIWQAIELLKVDRIDHGVRCQEDDALMALIHQQQIPLTVCPLSNLKLCVIDDMKHHNILQLLEAGLLVTVNSDDPTYFGGYLDDNFRALETSLAMSETQMKALVINGFKGSFLPEAEKQRWIEKVQAI
ncbi:adenosine deaminase [Alteromonas sp. H39]|uniref:adenosine deaminase n=1 Tax=Alteromonas sp. H39 TaxID=3389876 RepID=UPI0039E03CB4